MAARYDRIRLVWTILRSRGIEPFPTAELKTYDPGYVAGWVVERYQIDLVAAAQRARDAMGAKDASPNSSRARKARPTSAS